MKKLILLAIVVLPLFVAAQCGYNAGDTVISNTVTLVTATTARINGDPSNGDAAGTTITLRYVRVGQTDTTVSTTTWPTALRNLTGLVPGTQYVYYYSFNCLTQVVRQVGRYYFTTLTQAVVYTTERSTQFPYIRVDSGFVVPRIDTLLYRQPSTTGGNIVFRPADSVFYGWNKLRWVPLMNSTAGISNKVDSVIVSSNGDSLFYWINGVAYGQIFNLSKWDINGNAGTTVGTNFIGTTDAVDFVTKTNNTEKTRVTSGGLFGIGKTPVTILDVYKATGAAEFQLKSGDDEAHIFINGNGQSDLRFSTDGGVTNKGVIEFGSGLNINCFDGDSVVSINYNGGHTIIGQSAPGNYDSSFNVLKGSWFQRGLRLSGLPRSASSTDSVLVKTATGDVQTRAQSSVGTNTNLANTNLTQSNVDRTYTIPTAKSLTFFGNSAGIAFDINGGNFDVEGNVLNFEGTARVLGSTENTKSGEFTAFDLYDDQYKMYANDSLIIFGVDTAGSVKVTIPSTGVATFDARGSAPGFIFNDPVTLANLSVGTTQSAGDNSTKIATTAYVATAVAAGGTPPSGNYGNVQLNRNGIFATPASDSLSFSAGLSVKGTGTFTGLLTGTEAAFVSTATTGTGHSVTSSTITSGNLVSLSNTGTAATGNSKTVLNIATSGANATSTQSTWGLDVSNTNTGTASTNIAARFSASGGTNNYGLIVPSGFVGIGTSVPAHRLEVAGGTLATNSIQALMVSSTQTSGQSFLGNQFNMTTAGSAGSAYGTRFTLAAGYTGSNADAALEVYNSVAGTGTNMQLLTAFATPSINGGFIQYTSATTVGTNVGGYSDVSGGNTNYGLVGKVVGTKNSAVNIGVLGVAANAGTTPVVIGGYFGMQTTEATIKATSVALAADNGATTSNIFEARDAGTAVMVVQDGGNVGIGTTSPGQKLEVTGNIKQSGFNITPPTTTAPTTGGTVAAATTQWNVINPAGTLATLTITLPDNPVDGELVEYSFRQIITSLTVSAGAGGASVDGITTSAANSWVRWGYVASLTRWVLK